MLLTDEEIRAAIDATPITKNYSTDVARAIERAVLEKVCAHVAQLDCAMRCRIGAEIAAKVRLGAAAYSPGVEGKTK